MDSKELQRYLCTGDMAVVGAMQKIDANAKGILYVVDGHGRLAGSLTDGDIRRWIIKTGSLSGLASQMMRQSVKFLYDDGSKSLEARGMRLMHSMHITSVPIVHEDRTVKGILFMEGGKVHVEGGQQGQLAGIPVIVMAGGQGTRLYPYTKILPKPLIPVGEIPILERILSQFHAYGANEFYLTVNYRKEMIRSYFNDLKPDYTIHYVEEPIPLGTAGSIRLIQKEFHTPIIITNCDTIIEADYGEILKFHKQSHNALTIVSSVKDAAIPYGVLHAQGNGTVVSIEEKPQFSYLANTGMYVADPAYLGRIPEGTLSHMTDFAGGLLSDGLRVGMYPVSGESFLDMGEFGEMKKMEERLCGRTSGRIQ